LGPCRNVWQVGWCRGYLQLGPATSRLATTRPQSEKQRSERGSSPLDESITYAAWHLNAGAVAIGFFLAPRRLRRAFIRGCVSTNLYRLKKEKKDLEEQIERRRLLRKELLEWLNQVPKRN
jgi:hypothetical protein